MNKPEMIAELASLAREVRDYQAAHDLTTARLLREYPGLGSDKTLGLLTQADPAKLEDLDLDRWLAEYRGTVTLMRSLAEDKAKRDDIYDDLTTVKHLRLAVMEAMTDKGNSRLVLAVGPSGSGKTTAAEALRRKYGAKRVLLLEANQTWQSPGPMLDAVLEGMGKNDFPASMADKLRAVLGCLRDKRLCLCVDEAHHMGVPSLNLVKTLINQTQVEVVLMAMDTLMHRVAHKSWEEVRQLVQNRLAERVRYGTPVEDDVSVMVQRRTGLKPTRELTKELTAKATDFGHLKFVTLVCRRAVKLAGKDPVTPEDITTAMAKVEATR